MPDYPGVDPDGLIPGGLQVAGRVNANELAIEGTLLNPSVISVGSWNCNNGLSVINGASANLPLDTESTALADIAYVAGTDLLTILTNGIYIIHADAYSNVGWAAGSLRVRGSLSNARGMTEIPGVIGHEGSDTAGPFALFVGPQHAGDTISINVLNNTGVTDTFFGDINICRLA